MAGLPGWAHIHPVLTGADIWAGAHQSIPEARDSTLWPASSTQHGCLQNGLKIASPLLCSHHLAGFIRVGFGSFNFYLNIHFPAELLESSSSLAAAEPLEMELPAGCADGPCCCWSCLLSCPWPFPVQLQSSLCSWAPDSCRARYDPPVRTHGVLPQQGCSGQERSDMPQAAPAPGCSRLCWEAQQDEFPFILPSAVSLISANQPQTGLRCPSSATPGDGGENPESPLPGAAAAS